MTRLASLYECAVVQSEGCLAALKGRGGITVVTGRPRGRKGLRSWGWHCRQKKRTPPFAPTTSTHGQYRNLFSQFSSTASPVFYIFFIVRSRSQASLSFSPDTMLRITACLLCCILYRPRLCIIGEIMYIVGPSSPPQFPIPYCFCLLVFGFCFPLFSSFLYK